ncbi:hypothetical protein D9M71_640830 [compost metagenome]
MQATGDDFLSDARFTQKQHGCFSGRDLVDQITGLAVIGRLTNPVKLTSTQLQALIHVVDLKLQGAQLIDDGITLEVAHE